jgi:two-component system OmpR family sensor kinase
MKYQLTRLYLLIVVFAFLIIFIFSQLYNQMMRPQASYQIDASQVFVHAFDDTKPNIKLSQISRSQIALPNSLNALLRQGEIIKLADSHGYLNFYQLVDNKKLYRYGPIEISSQENEEAEFYFILLFYSTLALLVLGFIWPLFKDLAKLQKNATQFGETLQSIMTEIKPSSNIYPLAHTLEKMSHQIVESMQMHQDLSRTIAHEVRTPLARMKFLSEIIAPHINEEQRQRLSADIDEIKQLMQEYLSFERLEHEHYLMDFKLVNIERFLNDIMQKLDYQQRHIDVQFHSDANEAFFNEKAMNRALQNLINNALRYAKTRIVVCFTLQDNHCVLSVEDDGPGVGNEAKKLIQPFIRKESQNEKVTGYGLGLYIVRKILIWHQGHIELDNNNNQQGAIVTLTWPNTP